MLIVRIGVFDVRLEDDLAAQRARHHPKHDQKKRNAIFHAALSLELRKIQGTFPRIDCISSRLYARNVWLRTFPAAPRPISTDAAASSSGASRMSTPSYPPTVQKMSLTVTPPFLAVFAKFSARLVVPLISRIPCSVKFSNAM